MANEKRMPKRQRDEARQNGRTMQVLPGEIVQRE
jgi:hypothetical protein